MHIVIQRDLKSSMHGVTIITYVRRVGRQSHVVVLGSKTTDTRVEELPDPTRGSTN